MTALRKYQRLECGGLWRETPQDQRREVLVRFGDATLVLSDPKNGTAVSHWSLPAIERINPGQEPPVFAPGTEATESLELTDPEMIAALGAVRHAVQAATARPGRLRGVLLAGTAAAVVLAAVVWLPGALVRHTASVLPTATRAQIGTAALQDLSRLTGPACHTPLGDRALSLLSERLFGGSGVQLVVLPEALPQAASLPGNILLLGLPLLKDAPGPDVPAGFAMAETLRAGTDDPLLPILRHAGFAATVRLLTTGTLPEAALDRYGETFLAAARPRPADDQLLAAFDSAALSSTAYGYALDPTGETTLGLIEADPYRGGTPRELLNAEDWASLQAICD